MAIACSASPSATTGTADREITRRIDATVAAARPSPGPTTSARYRASPSSTSSAHSVSGSDGCSTSSGTGAEPPGDDTATRPAPQRAAPRAASPAAPSMPGLPATMRTAVDHLWASTGRCGATTPRRRRRRRGGWWRRDTSSPMSTTSTSPDRDGPSPNSRPGLSAWKVTVRSAASTAPACPPVDASRPLGMSTASTGPPADRRWRPRLAARCPIAGAVGGVDHQVAGRQPVGTRCGGEHLRPTRRAGATTHLPRGRQHRCCPSRRSRRPCARSRRRASRLPLDPRPARRAGPVPRPARVPPRRSPASPRASRSTSPARI